MLKMLNLIVEYKNLVMDSGISLLLTLVYFIPMTKLDKRRCRGDVLRSNIVFKN